MDETSGMAGGVIGVDVGGSKVLAGNVSEHGRVLTYARRQTPRGGTDPARVEDSIVSAIVEAASGYELRAVGVGAAGFVDPSRSTVRFSPHLPWREEELRASLQRRLGVPVLVDNDANAAGWAELQFGAGRGHRHLICLTLGTGIGGALIVDARVVHGSNGMAGEFGHMQVVDAGRPCECGNRGCWEKYASGSALMTAAMSLISAGGPAARRLRDLVDDDSSTLSGRAVTKAATEGDLGAIAIFQDVGSWLGTGIANLASAFDPELIVVGGGLSDAGDLLLEPAREVLTKKLPGRGFRRQPAIVKAGLGVNAGFIGAAALARVALESGSDFK